MLPPSLATGDRLTVALRVTNALGVSSISEKTVPINQATDIPGCLLRSTSCLGPADESSPPLVASAVLFTAQVASSN